MTISRSDFLQRIMKYCADAERSSFDVITKLNAWGVPAEEIDEIFQKLYSEKFVDDRRFARSYVSEKWNLDRWGKIKIENALQQKGLDENIIQESLNTINAEEYKTGLHELLREKLKEVKPENKPVDARRIMMFALSRGFEQELILDWIYQAGFEV